MLEQKLEQREAMHGMVYDEMIKAILHIIHKLDLSSIKGSSSALEVMSVRSYSSKLLKKPSHYNPKPLSSHIIFNN